jgi:small subunit ribosomal protein S16
MVVIRLARGGAKKNPFYRVVVADQRQAPRGRFIEQLGFYNPTARGLEETLRLDAARVEHWVNKGAQMSPRVKKLMQGAEKASA